MKGGLLRMGLWKEEKWKGDGRVDGYYQHNWWKCHIKYN